MTHSTERVDEAGRAFKGSQLQIQTYVNRRPAELRAGIVSALPELADPTLVLRWVSPLEAESFREYQDQSFLSALGLEQLADQLRAFWPSGGPVWDALARVEDTHDGGLKGVVLAEAKNYPEEMYSGGCRASSEESRRLIAGSLERTREWLGASDTPAWMGKLYQLANRLAHLYFLNEVAGVPAWFAGILFYDDVDHHPTKPDKWSGAMQLARVELDLPGAGIPQYDDVLLPARKREELVSSAVDA